VCVRAERGVAFDLRPWRLLTFFLNQSHSSRARNLFACAPHGSVSGEAQVSSAPATAAASNNGNSANAGKAYVHADAYTWCSFALEILETVALSHYILPSQNKIVP
jgi:hypothetical protein